jgi:hypothetical protein
LIHFSYAEHRAHSDLDVGLSREGARASLPPSASNCRRRPEAPDAPPCAD